ncbi:lactate racemase domain-containing protein, partial [candidate division KSB1 bacterium]
PEGIVLPKMIRARQKFDTPSVENIRKRISEEFKKTNINKQIKSGSKIAITAGSRGIKRIGEILSYIIEEVKLLGGEPFIISAMGSHGGNTIDGQKKILESYGITEKNMGAPIICAIDVVEIGKNSFGMPVYFDKIALDSDGIIAVNRIKSHTVFHSSVESGILKILSVGLGREKGASQIHELGVRGLKKVLPDSAKVIIEKVPVILGVGIIENALLEIAHIEAIEPDNIEKREIELLKWTKEISPKFLFENIDLLVVDEIGKNISGSCMDPNVIARMMIWGEEEPEYPKINRIAALDLTEESHGNVTGIGLSDIITRRLCEKINFDVYYTNILSANFLDRGKIPIVADSDEIAIKWALKTCWSEDKKKAKVVKIKNTLRLEEIFISKAILDEEKENDKLEPIGKFIDFEFDCSGVLNNPVF